MLGLKDIEYVNRDGDKPKLINTKDDNIANAIIDIIERDCGEYEHIAVICKCKKEAKALGKLLKGKLNFKYIEEPEDYNNRILLTTCATAKGIEFDAVIIPYANQENYNNFSDNKIYKSHKKSIKTHNYTFCQSKYVLNHNHYKDFKSTCNCQAKTITFLRIFYHYIWT